MERCARPDIAERLMMMLSPSDFPRDEVAELEDHLKACPACREEMNALKWMETFLGKNRDLVAETLSPCPSEDMIFAFAFGEKVDEEVERHVGLCDDCREHVELIRELSQEKIHQEQRSVSKHEKASFREAVMRAYPEREPHVGPIPKLLDFLRDWFHAPSLALGAAVAALLLVVLMPGSPQESRVVPVLSNVTWEKPSEQAKGDFEPKITPRAKKKVALILLFGGPAQAKAQEADEIYSKLDIVKRLGATYDFLSPKEISSALGGRATADSLAALSNTVFEKTNADYLLTFEIIQSKTGNIVNGTLFDREQKLDRGSISQTGLTVSRIPSRITGMGVELLLEAEHS